MNRLTKKYGDLIEEDGKLKAVPTYRVDRTRYAYKSDTIAIHKLGVYEDIEEDIGLELGPIFKALKNGIWYINDDEIHFSKNIKIYYDNQLKEYRLIIDDCTYLRVVDYKDSWALTRKDLEI